MEHTARRRARTLAEFADINARMTSADEAAASIRAYRPRPGDIVISPYAKCGTTWLQQAFHTLRTRGDLDFDDISRVVPWIETAHMLRLDLDAPQRAEPRGFKSHLPFEQLPPGVRCIVALRDPRDALVSYHRFMEGWFLEPGAVSIADFARRWQHAERPEASYWHHLLSWWAQRDNPDVLLLSYEHMVASPASHLRRIAAFCGIALDDELLALTLQRSSREFMLQHAHLFDDAMIRAVSEARGGLPPGSASAKVSAGGRREALPAEVDEMLDDHWARQVAPATGWASYALLQAELVRLHAAACGAGMTPGPQAGQRPQA